MLAEFRLDYNQRHFVRNETFKKAAEGIEVRVHTTLTPCASCPYTKMPQAVLRIDVLSIRTRVDGLAACLCNSTLLVMQRSQLPAALSFLRISLQGPARKIFVEFLERSCTAEFSGFLLYKELGRRLKKTNPVVAEVRG